VTGGRRVRVRRWWSPRRSARLAARGLRVDGDAAVVVGGVDLDVPRGRCVVLIGHNGSGKSTLLRLLAGEVVADAGTVSLDGVPRSAAQLRADAAIGAAVTDPSTASTDGSPPPDEPTVRQRILATAVRRGVDEDEVAAQLRAFGLEGHAEAHPHQLSSGLRQRAQLAEALVGPVDLLLLDDPTSFLDARTAEQVHGKVVAALRAGTAVVVATHDPDLVRALADEVLVLEDGRVAARGAPTVALASAAARRAGMG
jgi:ABC-type multidrug transport system ATPase subunit